MTASRSWLALADPSRAALRNRSGQPWAAFPPVHAVHSTSAIGAFASTRIRTASITSRTRRMPTPIDDWGSIPAGRGSRPTTTSRIRSRANSAGSPTSARAPRRARPRTRRSVTSSRPIGPVRTSIAPSGVTERGAAAISITANTWATAGSARSGISSAVTVAGTPASRSARSTPAKSREARTRTAMSRHRTFSCTWHARIASAM